MKNDITENKKAMQKTVMFVKTKIAPIITAIVIMALFGVTLVSTILYFQRQRIVEGLTNQVNMDNKNMAVLQVKNDMLESDKVSLQAVNTSLSASISAYQNAPKPTPMVKYVAPSHPNLSSCTLEGNFYFCPSDNCYYNPNGTRTGECKVPPMQQQFTPPNPGWGQLPAGWGQGQAK